MTPYDELRHHFGSDFYTQQPLARYTVARLGGSATALVQVKQRKDLLWVVEWVLKRKLPWRILGGGANVLIDDTGFDGLVIINQTREVSIDSESGIVAADSGANLTTLARRCMAKGLKGLEWAVSVPGTLGGAVVNNAGAHGSDMSANLLDAEVYFAGEGTNTLTLADFDYAYRHSILKGKREHAVVISARLHLEPGHAPAELDAIADAFVEHRKRTQPPGASLGSMFKNPPGDYAGRLIEAAGLKGLRAGGVQISPIHANFFVNTGGGTAQDYRTLIRQVQQAVQEQFGVLLELEVETLGNWEARPLA